MRASISALAPQFVHAQSTTKSLPVRLTDSRIVSISKGATEIGSMTSAWMPTSYEQIPRANAFQHHI